MRMKLQLLATMLVAMTAMSLAQGPATNALRPPNGAKVAIVVFEDLECPSCRSAEPVLKDAEKTYNVPLVRKDFPIPQHRWSAKAHVVARFFDTVSPQLGEDYRHWVFMNQGSINKSNFDQMTQKFAQDHNTALPMMSVDPSGQLQAKVSADQALGNSLHVTQTPTIFVVGDVSGQPVVELNNISELNQAIEQMKQRVQLENLSKTPAKATKSGRKGTKK